MLDDHPLVAAVAETSFPGKVSRSAAAAAAGI